MKTTLIIMIALFAIGPVAYAGDLEPAAPPASTMKTLDQVEPRIPITSVPLTISQSGSYYLTKNITAVGTAITVEANDVTIDLCGYTLKGPDTGINYGIFMSSRKNIEIRNGTVRDFYYGIVEDDEANTGFAEGHRVIDVRAVSNTSSGISLSGGNHLVKGCTVNDNGFSATSYYVFGIYAGTGSTITGNTVYKNGTSTNSNTNKTYGIYAGIGSTITSNTVYKNGTSAAKDVYGIYAAEGSTVTGCTVNDNGDSATSNVYGISAGVGSMVNGNTSNNNGYSASDVYGIKVGGGSTVTGNAAYNNGDSAGNAAFGIFVLEGCTVTGNTSYNNGNSASVMAYGIFLSGYCVVDQNTVYANGIGAGGAINMNTNIGSSAYGNNVAP